jgi:List-Bact-rpt repeat protein
LFSIRHRRSLAQLLVGPSRSILLFALVALGVVVGPSIASAQQLNLSWVDNAGGQASFIIQRALGTTGTYTQIAQVPLGVTSYNDTAVSLGSTYCYQVAAVNEVGVSAFSDLACASPAGGFTLTTVKAGTGLGTVSSSPAGIDCGTTCSYTYLSGKVVTLTATPSSGSTFSGWSGSGCIGTDPCTSAGNGSVTVTATFAAGGSAVTVNTVGPSQGAPGNAMPVTINGSGFAAGATVSVGGTGVTSSNVTVGSVTQLAATLTVASGAALGARDVTVTNSGGGSGTLAGGFTVMSPPAPAPTLTSISPATVGGGGAAFILTASGSGFAGNSVVQVNGVARTTAFVSANQLTATILASDIAAAGTVGISVATPAPGGGTTGTQALTVSGPAITVSATTSPPGGSITATLSNSPGGSTDWLVLATVGAPDTSYLQWVYVGAGVTNRTWVVNMPATVGTYEFRFYPNNGYTVAARSPAVSIAAASTASTTLTLAYNGKLQDRVGQGNTALAPDGALDGTLTATLSASGGRTVTALRLDSNAPGTWDTTSGTGYWALAVAPTLGGAVLNAPGSMAVNFPVADGGSFVVFASDYQGGEFLPGRTLTLTATFADGSTATAATTVPTPPPTTLTLAYNGKVQDRVGQGNTALAPDGALDGTLTATLSGSGGRTVTALRLDSNAPGTWDTTSGTGYWALAVAPTLGGAVLNAPGSMAVSFPVADGGSFVVFASDYQGGEFLPGRVLTLTATFADGSTATAVTTVPTPPPATLTLAYNGKLQDRVGQGNMVLAPDGALDGTLTATLSGSGGRTVTALRLDSDAPGTWDTTSGTGYWALAVAPMLGGAMLNAPGSMAVNFPVADGGSFVVFASDYQGGEFLPGRTLTLTATFADGSTATAVTTVP